MGKYPMYWLLGLELLCCIGVENSYDNPARVGLTRWFNDLVKVARSC